MGLSTGAGLLRNYFARMGKASKLVGTVNPGGENVLIIDDLIWTGGTLYESATRLKAEGSKSVSGFVVYAVFPKESWHRFLRNGGDQRAVFAHFWMANSNRAVSDAIP